MSMRDLNSGDPEVLRTSKEAFQVGEAVCHTLMAKIAAENKGTPEVLYCLGNLAMAVLQNMACLIARRPDEVNAAMRDAIKKGDEDYVRENFNPNKYITAESKLFAALLCNKMSPDYNPEKLSAECQMGPGVYWETIQAFEKITGYAPDPYIAPGMIKVGRSAGSMGADMLKAFMERKSMGGDSSSLN